MSEDDRNNQLVRVEQGALALTNVSDNRILSEMVGASLVLARDAALTQVELDAFVKAGDKVYHYREGMTENNIKAFELYHRAAVAGHVQGQYGVGKCYYHGDGIQKDYAEGIAWFQKAANAGFVRALTGLGTAYLSGTGVPKDENESIKWFHKAADAGSRGSCIILAQIHRDRNNLAEELKWWKEGALRGDDDSLCALAKIYSEPGQGIEIDSPEAYAWLRLYADEYSRQTNAADLAALMSPADFERANQLYQTFKEKYSGKQ